MNGPDVEYLKRVFDLLPPHDGLTESELRLVTYGNKVMHEPAETVVIRIKRVRRVKENGPQLLAALKALLNKRDMPHGFPDPEWYEEEFNTARTLIELLSE